MVNKKGWLRILEASIAILIVIGFMFTISLANKKVNTEKDLAEDVRIILDEIAQNTTLRTEIADYKLGTILSEAEIERNRQIQEKINNSISEKINKRIFEYSILICSVESLCSLNNYPENIEGGLYAAERIIVPPPTNTDMVNKKIRLSIWKKRA